MLKFYQWAKKTKLTQPNNKNNSNIHKQFRKQANGILYNSSQKRRQEVISHNNQTLDKQPQHRESLAQNQQVPAGKITIFKNSFIKQKIKETQTARVSQKIREKFRYQYVKAQDCQISVQKFLLKRIHENIQKSEQEKSQKQRHSRLTRSNRRYKTIQSQQSPVKIAQLNTINNNSNSAPKNKKHKPEIVNQWAQTSNLIEIDKSILNHIIRKQKEYQQKSLKIVSFCSKNSMNTTHRPSLSKLHANNIKEKTLRVTQNRSRYMKSLSVSKYRSSQHKINLKCTIQNDINGWNNYQKEEF